MIYFKKTLPVLAIIGSVILTTSFNTRFNPSSVPGRCAPVRHTNFTSIAPVFTYIGQGFDITKAVYAGDAESFPLGSQRRNPTGFTFSSDGTKMFVIITFIQGSSDISIVEYDLATAFDVSTASYKGEVEISAQDISPQGITFDPGGTKMFIIGRGGNAVVEYELGTAYDISTANHLGEAEEFSVATEEDDPLGITFDPGGMKMFIIGRGRNAVLEYELGTAYDVSTARYEREFLLAVPEVEPGGITFSHDGMKMFILEGSPNRSVLEYDLAIPYDISTVVYTGLLFSLSNVQAPLPKDLKFNPNGTKMFITGNLRNVIREYTLPVVMEYLENGTDPLIDVDANDGMGGANDVSVTYRLEGVDASLFSIDAAGNIMFNATPDFENPQDAGLDNVYEIEVIAANTSEEARQPMNVMVQNTGDTPIFTDAGQGFDVSTAVYAGNTEELPIAGWQGGARDLVFNADGTKIFFAGSDRSAIMEFNLDRAYDVSTAVHAGEFSVGAQERNPEDVTFNPSGRKMFIAGFNDDAIVEYDLGRAYDISTATYLHEFSVQPQGVNLNLFELNPGGTKMFVSGFGNAAILEYNLGTAHNVSTAVYAHEISVGPQESNLRGIAFNPDGTKMFIVGFVAKAVVTYDLYTPFDISTAVYAGPSKEFPLAAQEPNPEGLTFNPSGTKMFVIGIGRRTVVEYALASMVDYEENSEENVMDIDANDGLGGANDASVTYRLEGVDASLFSIDAAGMITFNSPPDFENAQDAGQDNAYEMVVVAANRIDESKQSIIVYVSDVEDELAPVVVTRDIVASLDATGEVSLTPGRVDNGSSDDIGIVSLSLDREEFTCADIGMNEVILTASDGTGKTASGTATVTIVDDLPPAVVTQDITVQLDDTGTASISPGQVDNGSSDNCVIATLSLDQTGFDCTQAGINTVTLTAVDGSGNRTSATATVTVLDNIAPTVTAQGLVVELDANGLATVSDEDINNAITDNCEIQSVGLDQREFSCSDLGNNGATLNILDQSGNRVETMGTVVVVDNLPPVLSRCPEDVIARDPIVLYDLPKATDNCSVSAALLVEGLESGSQFPVGITIVTYEFVDPSGNATTCSFQVTINELDLEPDIPTAFSPNGDGVNDTWNILNLDRYPYARLRVFDVSGNEVFSSTGYRNEWDGSYRGRILPVATYYYLLNLNDPNDQKLEGKITLIK